MKVVRTCSTCIVGKKNVSPADVAGFLFPRRSASVFQILPSADPSMKY